MRGFTQNLGSNGELSLIRLLRYHGRHVSEQRYHSPFDITVDNWKVEIKTALSHESKTGSLEWTFNLHRHGKQVRLPPDFYILRLEDVPYSKQAIHLLISGDCKTLTFRVSMKGLLSQSFASNFSMFQGLCSGNLTAKVVTELC